MKDERTTIFHLDFTTAPPDNTPTNGLYLVHYFWTEVGIRGERECHEAQQYYDHKGFSEITEVLGEVVARKLRTLKPGQGMTWDRPHQGNLQQILVNRIW